MITETLTPTSQPKSPTMNQSAPKSMSTQMPQGSTSLDMSNDDVCLQTKDLNLFYGQKQALFDVNMLIPRKRVTAFIGPSGCGKSTLLRTFNRMNDLVDGCKVDGQILMDGQDIFDKSVDITSLRRRVGMVFQKPNPFPKSIYENV